MAETMWQSPDLTLPRNEDQDICQRLGEQEIDTCIDSFTGLENVMRQAQRKYLKAKQIR